MGKIFYGSKETAITVDEWMVNCPSCEAHNAEDSQTSNRYLPEMRSYTEWYINEC
ncbi:MAG: hypothetical protein ABJC98_07615 [Bacteroidota bacterium]